MRRVLLCSWLLALVAVPFMGQTNEWKRYKNTDGNFTVLFPGNPEDSVNKTDSGSQSHTLMAIQRPAIYTVVYTTMAEEQKVDNATYEIFKNAVFKELPKCEVGKERPAVPALGGYIGHWYLLNCDMPNTKVTIEANLYWGKHYAYAVMVMFPADVTEPQMTNKFLESFGVIDQGK